jgi:hypothetical protein
MEEQDIRAALKQHPAASASGDQDAEHAIYADDSVCDYSSARSMALDAKSVAHHTSSHEGAI